MCIAFNCRILCGLYLRTVIVTTHLVFHHPLTLFIPGLKRSFSANPSHCSPSFLLPFLNIHYVDSPDCLLSFLAYCFSTFSFKVMISGERQMVRQKYIRWPCGVCSKGVGSNSIQCSSCQKWVHKKCCGIKGSMSKVAKSFICRGCLNPVTSAGRTSVDIGASAKLS